MCADALTHLLPHALEDGGDHTTLGVRARASTDRDTYMYTNERGKPREPAQVVACLGAWGVIARGPPARARCEHAHEPLSS